MTPKRRAQPAGKREAALRTVTEHEFSQEMYAKLIGEKIRKALLVDGAEPCTAGAQSEGEANFNKKY
jgi:hypothetical protein